MIPVDAYSVLEAHKDEYIYFRTDHHWSDLGAYYAYTAFCNAIGQTPMLLMDGCCTEAAECGECSVEECGACQDGECEACQNGSCGDGQCCEGETK